MPPARPRDNVAAALRLSARYRTSPGAPARVQPLEMRFHRGWDADPNRPIGLRFDANGIASLPNPPNLDPPQPPGALVEAGIVNLAPGGGSSGGSSRSSSYTSSRSGSGSSPAGRRRSFRHRPLCRRRRGAPLLPPLFRHVLAAAGALLAVLLAAHIVLPRSPVAAVEVVDEIAIFDVASEAANLSTRYARLGLDLPLTTGTHANEEQWAQFQQAIQTLGGKINAYQETMGDGAASHFWAQWPGLGSRPVFQNGILVDTAHVSRLASSFDRYGRSTRSYWHAMDNSPNQRGEAREESDKLGWAADLASADADNINWDDSTTGAENAFYYVYANGDEALRILGQRRQPFVSSDPAAVPDPDPVVGSLHHVRSSLGRLHRAVFNLGLEAPSEGSYPFSPCRYCSLVGDDCNPPHPACRSDDALSGARLLQYGSETADDDDASDRLLLGEPYRTLLPLAHYLPKAVHVTDQLVRVARRIVLLDTKADEHAGTDDPGLLETFYDDVCAVWRAEEDLVAAGLQITAPVDGGPVTPGFRARRRNDAVAAAWATPIWEYDFVTSQKPLPALYDPNRGWGFLGRLVGAPTAHNNKTREDDDARRRHWLQFSSHALERSRHMARHHEFLAWNLDRHKPAILEASLDNPELRIAAYVIAHSASPATLGGGYGISIQYRALTSAYQREVARQEVAKALCGRAPAPAFGPAPFPPPPPPRAYPANALSAVVAEELSLMEASSLSAASASASSDAAATDAAASMAQDKYVASKEWAQRLESEIWHQDMLDYGLTATTTISSVSASASASSTSPSTSSSPASTSACSIPCTPPTSTIPVETSAPTSAPGGILLAAGGVIPLLTGPVRRQLQAVDKELSHMQAVCHDARTFMDRLIRLRAGETWANASLRADDKNRGPPVRFAASATIVWDGKTTTIDYYDPSEHTVGDDQKSHAHPVTPVPQQGPRNPAGGVVVTIVRTFTVLPHPAVQAATLRAAAQRIDDETRRAQAASQSDKAVAHSQVQRQMLARHAFEYVLGGAEEESASERSRKTAPVITTTVTDAQGRTLYPNAYRVVDQDEMDRLARSYGPNRERNQPTETEPSRVQREV